MAVSDTSKPRNSPDLAGPPQGYFVIVPPRDDESTVDLGRIARVLREAWMTLALAVLTGCVIAALISLQMRNVYRSEALIAPVTQGAAGNAAALRNQFGGLAALAGIDLGGGGGRKEEFLATLSSAGFARDYILAENLMPVLFSEKWDADAGKWREGREPPTIEDGVKLMMTDVRTVSEDRRTGLVRVRVDWYEPETAARWANGLVALANARLRDQAIRSSALSIEYLNKELEKTSVVGLQQAIYRLIESQVNNSMFATVQPEYAFKVIDPAVPSDPRRKVAPHRTLIALGGGLLGGVLALGWVLWRQRAAWLQ